MSAADLHLVNIHNYFELAALTLLYYDHLITFLYEVSLIWSRSVSRPFILFLLNRYVPFFGNIVVSIFSLTNLVCTDKSCKAYGLARQLLLVFNQVLVSVLLAMRIMALYSNSRSVIGFIVGSGVILVTLACWSLFGQHSTAVPGVQGCHLATSEKTGIYLAVAWEAQATFDVLIFAMTIKKTLQTRRVAGKRVMQSDGVGLMDLVFRDGAIYFAVMALANLANILTFYFAVPILKGVLSTFASCISITMMSRLLLNLYEAISTRPSSRTGSTTLSMIFTTRIEAGGGSKEYDADPRVWSDATPYDEVPALADGGDETCDIELVSAGRNV